MSSYTVLSQLKDFLVKEKDYLEKYLSAHGWIDHIGGQLSATKRILTKIKKLEEFSAAAGMPD